jgi:hypothetical protein
MYKINIYINKLIKPYKYSICINGVGVQFRMLCHNSRKDIYFN